MRERFVESGALLLTRQEPVEGENGTDIYGKDIPCPPVKDAELDALAGNGTEVDGETIVAKRAGRPIKKNNRLEVLPVYEVSSDLDYSVGNLRFPGDIIIKGDVRPGFEIIATGSVTVGGVCEDSSISAGADIILNGVVGNEHTRLEAGGNITAKFINSATVEVAEELNVANELINCTVTAKRVITTEKGRIVGGEITVEEEIDAGTLGSDEGIKTYLRVSPPDPRDKAGPVRARRRTCPGVRVHIKLGMTNVEDALPPTSFWDVDGTIVKLKADADDADLDTTGDGQEEPQARAS